MIGDDFSNTPPAHALSRRGIVENVRGFMVYGDYADAARVPPSWKRWGAATSISPSSGGRRRAISRNGWRGRPLTPVEPEADGPALPMAFDISMGVRREDADLRREIDDALVQNRKAIDAILAEYGVPRLDPHSEGRSWGSFGAPPFSSRSR